MTKSLYCVTCKAKREATILYHYQTGRIKKCPYCGMVTWAEYDEKKG